MFHTSLLTKNLLVFLVVFSFSWGFNAVNLPSNVSACMIEEEDEDDPEEEQDPYAELINKKYRINAGAFTQWETVPNSEEVTAVNFSQKKGSAKLEAKCNTKMVVPAGNVGQKFKVKLEVRDQNNSPFLVSQVEHVVVSGTSTVINQNVLVDGYTGNKMTVRYQVFMKDDAPFSEYPQNPVAEWEIIFNKN